MKSGIILISIFLLAICLITPLSASDNITDDSLQTADEIEVSFNDTVYEKDLGYIGVDLPDNTSGNLKATINNVEFYNEYVNNSVNVPISIPKGAFPIYVVNKDTDHTSYKINLFFNDTEFFNSTLNVMRLSPNYTVSSFPSEILKDDPNGYISLYFPESANGEIKIYIDGEFAFNLTANHFTFLNATKFNTLALGNHNVTVVYMGDRYYKKFNKTFDFTVVDMLIQIPTNIVLAHDDCISARILNNADGIVTVYVDNVPVFKDRLDKRGEFLHSLFNDVTCGEHLIEVQYNASDFNKSKKQWVNVSYYVEMFVWGSFVYGEDNEVIIIVLEDFKKDLINITIDGVRYTNFEIDNSGWIELDVSKLDVGNHTVVFDFPGDEKYYNYTLSTNFTVYYKIVMPFYDLRDTQVDVYLTLPNSAKGSLEVYINGKPYKTSKLVKGSAKIVVDTLIPGEYDLSARYTGKDFNISEVSEIIEIYPDITTPGEIYCGQDKSIVVKTLKTARGKVIFNVNGKNITVNMEDGKAILSLKNFKEGYYDDIQAFYIGDNGFMATLYSAVDILPAVKLTNLKVTSENAKMKVYIKGKLAKNTYVTFKVDKKIIKVKTSKNGVATIKLNPGKHTIIAIYKNSKVSKGVNVHVISLKTVTVKKSTKKVVLKATLKKGRTYLKNKVVKFKFNGKTIKAKTNNKGIVKVTFKTSKLEVGQKVTYSASYAKDTVKKTAIVKK